jgi:2-amino-4-hydroxy-6-hydroxymethyldihydropteridine diphosphokinase
MVQFGQEFAIALGANLETEVGSPADSIRAGLEALALEGILCVSVSRFYKTPCFPVGAGPDYVNACAVLRTDLAPEEILAVLHRIEAQMGRVRETRWAGRTLDLDLLFCAQAVLPDRAGWSYWQGMALEEQMRRAPEELILPHPRLQDRGFVLVPLADVAPDWQHPVTGRRVVEMRDALPKEALLDIVPL